MEPAPIQSHSLTFNGGNETTKYSIGGSYFQQDGLMKETRNDYQRFNIRTRIETKVNDWLDIGGNINLSYGQQHVGENAAWFQSYFAVPIMPVFDDQNVDASPFMLSNAQQLGYRGRQNPYYALKYNDNRNNIYKVNGNMFLDFDIIEDKLSFRSAYNYGLGIINNRRADFAFNDGVTDNLSALRKESFNYFDQVWDNYLTYENSFGSHGLTLVGGHSYRSETQELLFVRGEDIPTLVRDREELWYLSRAANFDLNGIGDSNDQTINAGLYFLSFFGRAAYDYDGRYLFYTTFRRDGNNKFQQKWANYTTVGAGWVISEESFFNVPFVNYLKFRAGWGQIGNDGIAPAEGAPTLEAVETAIDNVLTAGNSVSPTFDLIDRPERTNETNIGLSATLLNSHLTVEADYFVRNSEDLAVLVEPPVIRGLVRRSIGEVRNSGFEMSIGWNNEINNDISYYVRGNFATLSNEVRSLGGANSLNAGSAEFRQISIIGEPYQAFYGYEINGVFQNTGEIDNSGYTTEFIADNGLEPGDYFFKDQNGDGEINDLDRVILGSFLPELTYGISFGVTWKSLSLAVDFQGQSGHEILNRKRGEVIFTNDTNIDADLATNLWRGEGTSNIYPSAAGIRKGWNQNMSEYFVEDGSYFRIQNVRLAYDIPTQQWGDEIPKATVIFTAERPLTVFDYNGFNPEVPNGIDRQVYPIPAIYTMGLNVTF
jgi:TonB-linked SusC/RagA family outer membrane protein